MISKVLIANRGVIACRIIRTLKKMGLRAVAVYSDADRHSQHVDLADESVRLGPALASESYLNVPAILKAAEQTGAEAIHPGYGFLSENAGFAEACEAAGLIFVGPTPAQMRVFSLKHQARGMAQSLGVPLLPGTELLTNLEDAEAAAERIGFPVMLKSTAGGGGIGIRLCRTPQDLEAAFESTQRLGSNNFGNAGVFIERFVERARHIEVQIFGDGKGEVIALGERDCSTQRRNQKVIEETPAPRLSPTTRARLFEAAVKLGNKVNYRSAGTVEFIYDDQSEEFFFLEVNTRLQVEHGVTEEVTGIDLVEWMILNAAGKLGNLTEISPGCHGHSIQVRVYAENPAKDFQPSSGRLTHVKFPSESARIETWVEPGSEVSPFYDPMLAKVIVHAEDRPQAIEKLRSALRAIELAGIESNVDYLRSLCDSEDFRQGVILTSSLSRFRYQPANIEVLQGGMQTTLQDLPGRLGYWNVGVPPSGPMDDLAFRLANRLAGNEETATALEITMAGPTLKFSTDAWVALTGAPIPATLDNQPFPLWQGVRVQAGAVLNLSGVGKTGMRSYLAVAGGFKAPQYLGSHSTFMLGGFGGHAGRALRTGDILHIDVASAAESPTGSLPEAIPPQYPRDWEIGVLYGPHGAPDFFHPDDIEMLFNTSWKVHYHSDRTGVRLIGPRPKWARKDGGEAGLHPSNIHDNAYAVGTIDFTGDMPIILGPDGPSLGGFVCPATVVSSELWKVGQVRPGDTIRFRRLTTEPAIVSRHSVPPAPAVTVRADGDRYLLVEFGENVLDFELRLRAHALETALRKLGLKGIIDLTPGIRSLHVHYNPRLLSRAALLEALTHAERTIPVDLEITVPSRIVHLPLSWDDPQARLAAEKYMQAVRPDAPWCPSNIEFIRRINGLESIENVRQIVFDASYLVLGLGDVYLGAPVATPINPTHRLVTTKYNPARTWTPENAVGIGGAYLCVYGMEGPGGYQLFGRTIQMWNTFRSTPSFEPGKPWLLRFFDQIRFFPVTASELLEIRDAFPYGKYNVRVEESQFSYPEYRGFLQSNRSAIDAAKQRQQRAFSEERARWEAAGQATIIDALTDADPSLPLATEPEGCQTVQSPLTASVWKILVEVGARVQAGQQLICLEAMKTELMVNAPAAGRIREIPCKQGSLVTPGQTLILLEVD